MQGEKRKKYKILFLVTIVLTMFLIEMQSAVNAKSTIDLSPAITAEFNNTTGELTIAGRGEIPSDAAEQLESYADKVKTVRFISIGTGITNLSADLFKDFSNLTTVILPNTITTIESGVFQNCTNLKSILIPSEVSVIGDAAFSGCTSLRDVVILSDSITLGQSASGAFDGLDLSKITIYYTKYQGTYARYNRKQISDAKNIGNAICIISEVNTNKNRLHIFGEGTVAEQDILNYCEGKNIKYITVGKDITQDLHLGSLLYGCGNNLEEIRMYKDENSIIKDHIEQTFGDKIKYIYTINYYANGQLIDTQEIVNGENLKTISNIDNYKPSNEYTFAGWSTTQTGAKVKYTPEQKVENLTKDINLYVLWSRDARFHYASGEGTKTLFGKQYYNNNNGQYYYTDMLEIPARAGWEKVGWRRDGEAVNDKYTYKDNDWLKYETQDYYAVYQRDAYFYSGVDKSTVKTVKQYYNPKNGKYALVTLGDYNDNIADIDGWTIDGWTTNENSNSEAEYGTSESVEISDNVFYAIYKRNITIEYSAGDDHDEIKRNDATQYYNSNGPISGMSGKYQSEDYFKSVRAGYVFDNWYSYNDYSTHNAGDNLNFYPDVNSSSPKCSIKANWKRLNTYTITYYLNNGTQDVFATRTKYEGEAIHRINDIPARDGYHFVRWNTKADGTGTDYSGPYTSNADLNVYAIWEENSADTYTVTYDLNIDGNVSDIPNPISQTQSKVGSSLVISDKTPKTIGYIFKGWNTKSDGTGIWYQPSDTYQGRESGTLYAMWEAKTLTVKFMRNQNSQDTMFATQTFTYGVSGQTFADRGWSKDGYTQGRWYYNKECDSQTSHSINASVSDSFIEQYSGDVLTLYASWKINTANIYYYGNGATEYREKADAKTGRSSKYKKLSYTSTDWSNEYVSSLFKKQGYHIESTEKAWIVGSPDSNEYMSESFIDSSIGERLKTETGFEVKLYANWIPDVYEITLDNGGATTEGTTTLYEKYDNGWYLDNECTNKMTTSENGITVPEKTYTVEYNYNDATGGNTTESATATYTFGGYYTIEGGTGAEVITAEGKIWQENSFNTFFDESGTIYASWGGSSIELPTPTKTGYIFRGWYSDSTFKTKVGNGGENYTPTENVTLYAKWENTQITEITLNTDNVKKDYYVGEELNTAGIVVTAHYNDGTEEVVTEGITYSGFDSSTAGEKQITVSYGGQTATYNVTVVQVELTINNHPYVQIDGTIYIIVEKETTVGDLLDDIELNLEGYNLIVEEDSEKVVDTSNVKTGQNLAIENTNININVVSIVKGDVNSDGEVDFKDIMKFNNYRLYGENVANLNDAEKIAFKALKNTTIENATLQEIEFADVVLLNNYRLK